MRHVKITAKHEPQTSMKKLTSRKINHLHSFEVLCCAHCRRLDSAFGSLVTSWQHIISFFAHFIEYLQM